MVDVGRDNETNIAFPLRRDNPRNASSSIESAD
jgi:hypothetical protein